MWNIKCSFIVAALCSLAGLVHFCRHPSLTWSAAACLTGSLSGSGESIQLKPPYASCSPDLSRSTDTLDPRLLFDCHDQLIAGRSESSVFERKAGKHLSAGVTDKVQTLLLFVGYPRSCHSLVGSLLDAHPNMIVAHEYNLLSRWAQWTEEQRTDRNFVFNELFRSSKDEAQAGVRRFVPGTAKARKNPNTYFYGVPHQFQGTYHKKLSVVGDKRGGLTSIFLSKTLRKAHTDLDKAVINHFQEMSSRLQVRLKFIHVVRNPYDIIATILLRKHGKRVPANQSTMGKVQIDSEVQRTMVQRFFKRMARPVAVVRNHFPVLDFPSEEFIANPTHSLKKLCSFLQVECSKSYFSDCSSIVHSAPSKTRNFIAWTENALDIIRSQSATFPFFKNYTYKY